MIIVKVKSRNELLNDVIKDAKKHPKGWKAIFGQDNKRLSRDYYILNPDIGIYFLKDKRKKHTPSPIKNITIISHTTQSYYLYLKIILTFLQVLSQLHLNFFLLNFQSSDGLLNIE